MCRLPIARHGQEVLGTPDQLSLGVDKMGGGHPFGRSMNFARGTAEGLDAKGTLRTATLPNR